VEINDVVDDNDNLVLSIKMQEGLHILKIHRKDSMIKFLAVIMDYQFKFSKKRDSIRYVIFKKNISSDQKKARSKFQQYGNFILLQKMSLLQKIMFQFKTFF